VIALVPDFNVAPHIAAIISNLLILITAFTSGVLSPLITGWIRNKIKEGNVALEEDEISQYLQLNEKIDERIKNIRQEYNLDRVWIAQFHNGGSFYNQNVLAMKFQKFSLTYEACKPGVSSEVTNIVNIPVSLFSSVLKEVKEQGHFGVCNVNADDVKVDILKQFWLDRGINGFHIFAIKCLDKRFLGFLCCDCIGHNCEFNNDTIQNLIVESKILGGYLLKTRPETLK